MSISGYGNGDDKVKESIDSIRERLRKKRRRAVDFFEESSEEVSEDAEPNISNLDIAEGELVKDFKVVYNSDEFAKDFLDGREKIRRAKNADRKERERESANYIPVVRKILSSKSV